MDRMNAWSRGHFITALGLSGVTLAYGSASAAEDAPQSVTIAHQPGIGYMPLIVLQRQGILQKRWPQTNIAWRQISPAAIRDEIITNRTQIGAIGTEPFLIGWDKGVPWKILCSANTSDLPVVVMDPQIKSIRDLKPSDKIAMPSLDSSQALIVRKALQNAGLDPHSLDSAFVALDHPTAEQALIAHQLTAHVSAPPFYQDELKRGAHIILHKRDVFQNDLTVAVIVVNTEFAQQYPRFVGAFFKDYVDAVNFIKTHREDAAKMYVEYTEGKANLEETTEILRSLGNTLYTVTPRGVLEAATYMKQLGMLQKVPASLGEVALQVSGKALAPGN